MARPGTRSSALLAQASQHLWLASCYDVYREFTSVHHTIHPAPSPPDAGRYTLPSRFRCQSSDCGYRVRRRCTGRYLPAHLRRILLMEQQVWSIQLARQSTLRPRVAATTQSDGMWNFRQRNAFEQAELILQAALDPTIASRAKKGEFVKCFDHFDLLQTAIN